MLPNAHRPRRLRRTGQIRELVRETALDHHDLVLPLFVSARVKGREAVPSMPGVFQLDVAECVREAEEAVALGIRAVLLFGIPHEKDEHASAADSEEGIVQAAVRALKTRLPELVVTTDVCLCEYTDHGHCGIIRKDAAGHRRIDNDASIKRLAEIAVSHAQAGADIVAPSDMMDGRVRAIRAALDEAGFQDTAILSYAVKYCSAFYAPFREAADSAPQFGDRQTYQMDPANVSEALREAELDIREGADMIMVKPGLPYLDVLWRVKEKFGMPTAAYHVSGEYAMLKAAAERGWLDEKRAVMETLLAFKRAGADLIVTYFAKDAARWL